MTGKPFFSVLVPTYNQAQYVGQALDTLLRQTDPDWEAVVVNDGSTDDTPAVLAHYSELDGRIRVIHQLNGGTGSALNAGLRHARGEWVCWLSSDDFFDARKLEIHRRAIAQHPGCRFFFTYSQQYDDATGYTARHPFWRPNANRLWQILNMLRGNFVHGNSICVSREAWMQTGYFNENLRYAQDYDMWLRLITRYPATLIPEPTCITRYHPGQGTHRFPEACQFDSAKAAITFINTHDFAGLVPLVDLDEPGMAEAAVMKALSIAGEAAAYLYALGPHPGLLRRIVEWAWELQNGRIAPHIQAVVRAWAWELCGQYRGSDFGSLWECVARVGNRDLTSMRHEPVSHVETAERYLFLLRREGNHLASAVERYLREFEGSSFADGAYSIASGWPGDPRNLIGTYTAMARKRRWFPLSAMGATARCPSLLSNYAWWSTVMRSTVPGQVALKLGKIALDPNSAERQQLYQAVEHVSRHWPRREAA